MAAKKDKKKQGQPWRPATRLVHEGTLRSQFGETSEAIFLNSGYVYDSAEQAERRFKGDEEGFVYSRYSNPTVAMFEIKIRDATSEATLVMIASRQITITPVISLR